jgi:L-fuconolactonase
MSASGRYGEPRIASAIVSFTDLMSPQIERVLASHAGASERFRGIRHAAGWHPDNAIRNSHSDPFEGMLASPEFRRGFKVLVDQGWSFDAWLYHHQIDELTDLASAFPEANIVLDHFGGPLGIGPYAGQATQVFEDWRRSVSMLSQLENVKVKLGGLVMPVNGFGLHKRAQPPTSDELVALTRQYYLTAIELFGVERCMFESNFPVDRQSCSYRVLWNAFKKLVQDFSTDERDQLFYRTAMQTYRIDAGGSAT